MSSKARAKPRGKPFLKGKRNPRFTKNAGRKKGTPNKFTRDVKEAVLNALEKLGGEDWLVKLGRTERKAFAALLGKAMPMQVTGKDGKDLLPSRVDLAVSFVTPAEEQS